MAWTRAGIWFSASVGTGSYLHRLDPEKRSVTRVAPAAGWAGSGWNLTRDGSWISYVAGDAEHYPEVFLARAGEPGLYLASETQRSSFEKAGKPVEILETMLDHRGRRRYLLTVNP